MVTEMFMKPFIVLVNWLIDLLPEHELDVPAIDGVVSFIRQLNSLVPIGPVLQLAVTILGMLGVFITIRLVLMVRHVVLP